MTKILVSMFGILCCGSMFLDGHIPLTLGVQHVHTHSICWGYAQARAFGKFSGDNYCNPDNTYSDHIYEDYFPFVSSDDDPDFSGLECGDILVWGSAPRGGLSGHAAYVVFVPYPLVLNTVKIDHVPNEYAAPQTGMTLAELSLGSPAGYHKGSCFTAPNLNEATIYYQNSFPRGVMYTDWIESQGFRETQQVPLSREAYLGETVHVKAVDNQTSAIAGVDYQMRFRFWDPPFEPFPDVSDPEIQFEAELPGSWSCTAVFRKEYNINIIQPSYLEPATGGTYKVNNVSVGSSWGGAILEEESILLEVIPPEGYLFVDWSDGVVQNLHELTPEGHVSGLHASLKGHRRSTTSAATGPNNQRKIATAVGASYAVYSSAGSVWFTKNTGSGWSNEIRLSSTTTARNPSICISYGGPLYMIHIVWEEVVGTFRYVYYRRSQDAGASFEPAITLVDEFGYFVTEDEDATPVVVTGSPDVVVIWKFWGGLALRAVPSYNSSTYSIPETNESSLHPAVIYGSRNSDGNPAFLLAYEHAGSLLHFKELMVLNYGNYSISWASTEPPLTSTGSPVNPSITAGTAWGDKRAVVAWDALAGGNRRVYAKERNSGGAWQAQVEFSHGTHQCTKPVVNLDDTYGKINLLWQCDNHIAKSARAVSGSVWTATIDRGAGSSPSIAAKTDAGQLPLAAWMTGAAVPYTLHLPSFGAPAQQSYSPSATAGNGQRKLARGSSGTLYLTYESEGDIFFTKSTDNGSSWSQAVYLSKGYVPSEYPSIAERGGHLYVAWHTKLATSIYNVAYNYSTNDGSTWLTNPVSLSGAIGCPAPGPTPAIALTKPSGSFEIIVVFRESSRLTSRHSTTNPPASSSNWTTVNVANTTSSSRNPSLWYHPNSWPPFRLAWDEAGTSVKHQYFYYSSWSSVQTFNPMYSQNTAPSVAISGDNSVYLAFQGGGGGYNPWIYVTKNLNTTYYTSFGVGANYLQPSVTGHSGGRASLLWFDATNAIKKVVYDGTNWSSEGTIATGGKYISASITNPPGGSAYAVWTGASGIPYSLYVGPGSGPLQQAGGEETFANILVHSRSLQFSHPDGSGHFVVEMASPEVTTPDGARLRLPFKALADTTIFTLDNVSEVLGSVVLSGYSGTLAIKAKVGITAGRSSTGSRLDVPLELRITDDNTGAELASTSLGSTSADTVLITQETAQMSVSTGALGRYRVSLVPDLSGLRTAWTEETDKSPMVAVIENYQLAETSADAGSEAVAEYRPQAAPTEFDMGVYPNPFNPATIITYQLPFDADVRLVVYDMLGREVALLADATRPAGYYTAMFDRARFSSGLYFARLLVRSEQAGHFMHMRKLLLAK